MQDSLRAIILAVQPEKLYSSKPLSEIFGVEDVPGMELEENSH